MRKDYLRKVKRLSKAFVNDVIETTLRIHKKDQKAYPLRVHKSVSKRFNKVHRYQVTLLLIYLEEIGFFESTLESVEEFRERMQDIKGLYERGRRRRYFRPSSGVPKDAPLEYRKITHEELGIFKDWEYPV